MTSTFERPTNPTPLKIERPPLKVLADAGGYNTTVFSGDENAVMEYLKGLPNLRGLRVECAPTNCPAAKDWIGFTARARARQNPQAQARPERKPDADLLTEGMNDPRANPACPYCQKGTPHHHNAAWSQAMLRRQGIGRA